MSCSKYTQKYQTCICAQVIVRQLSDVDLCVCVKDDFHDIADAAALVNYMYSNVCDSGVFGC